MDASIRCQLHDSCVSARCMSALPLLLLPPLLPASSYPTIELFAGHRKCLIVPCARRETNGWPVPSRYSLPAVAHWQLVPGDDDGGGLPDRRGKKQKTSNKTEVDHHQALDFPLPSDSYLRLPVCLADRPKSLSRAARVRAFGPSRNLLSHTPSQPACLPAAAYGQPSSLGRQHTDSTRTDVVPTSESAHCVIA